MWDFISGCLTKNRDSMLFDGKNSVTYAELLLEAEKNGETLKKLVPSKAKCAILCEKGLNAAVAILSCWCAGLVVVPMSKNYGERHCESIVALTDPDVVIHDKNEPFEITNRKCVSKPEEILCDVAAIMCTSGTTGTPKGAMITEQGLTKNIENIAAYFDIQKGDTIMIARPLYHCAVLTGEFLVSLYRGLDVGFFDGAYDPVSLIKFMGEHNVTVFCGTPTLLSHIAVCMKRSISLHPLKGEGYRRSGGGVPTIAVSGECLSKKAAANIRSAFADARIYSVYGLTEAAPRVSWLPPEHFDAYPESVGVPLNDTYVRITDIDSDGNGKIQVKSPSVMKGYYNDAAATKRALVDGWLDTGDIGHMDGNGFLYIASRADDMIIKAGMNIYPKEIENAIEGLDCIESSIAYGVRGDDGEIVAVDVVLRSTSRGIGKKELMKMFAGVLPPYQMPSVVNIVGEHRKNASGKIIRGREQS